MKIRLTIAKMTWRAAEAIRSRLRPLIAGTVFYRFLQIPSKFIRHRLDWRKLSKDSIFCREEEMAMCSLLPSRVLDMMITRFKPKTVLDVGCGTGKAIDYLLSRGIDAVGIEGSGLAISKATSPQRITQANLNKPVSLNRRFDAVFSYEVVEHIHPDNLDALLSTFAKHSDLVIISHAQPGQGGEGHFNEQPDEYWIEQFERINYEIDWPSTREFKSCGDMYAANMLVFRRAASRLT
jgi:SAM-dependent methyltransferase